MRALVAAVTTVVAVAISSPAAADISAGFQRPIPTPQLAAGTVQVIARGLGMGEALTGIRITLVVDGISLYATTGHDGRTQFDHIRIGASVIASAADTSNVRLTSEPFVVPSDAGIALGLMMKYAEEAPLPSVRERSGLPVPDAATTKTIVVRLTYNDLKDPKPPAGVTVTLVGYPTAGAITIATRASDAHGEARFDKLDDTGATAYYVMTQLPRAGHVDRLVSQPIVLDRGHGAHVVLSSDKRDSKAAPLDDEPKPDKPAPIPAGKIRLALTGAPDKTSTVSLVDAATGNLLARVAINSPDDHADVAVKTAPNQVVYAETTAAGKKFRSHPFQPLTATGSTAALYIYPQVAAKYRFIGEAIDPVLRVTAHVELSNYSWTPAAVASEIPLPRGFTNVEPGTGVRTTATGIVVTGTIPPGGRNYDVAFDLRAIGTKVVWTLDLPYGAMNSVVAIVNTPGVSVTPPTGVRVETQSRDGGSYLVMSNITITPNHSMVMSITVPPLPPLARACGLLRPDSDAHAVGKPVHGLALPQLDGTKLELSSLRGKVIVVTFMASWDQLSGEERPQIAKLAAAVPDAVDVLVFSDADPKAVRPVVDASAKYRVVLDAPVGDSNIGPTTLAWGTKLLPETYVVDRKGIVRYYFANARDWSTAEATACISALAHE